jgi:hypothetical protein
MIKEAFCHKIVRKDKNLGDSLDGSVLDKFLDLENKSEKFSVV